MKKSTNLTTRPIRTLILVTALTLAASSCGAASEASSANDGFWSPLMVIGDEVEGYDSLKAMGGEADLVVLAQFAGFERTRSLQYDAEEDIVNYASASLKVDEVIKGTPPTEPLAIEFLMTQRPDELDGQIAAMAEELPRGQMLLFLRAKKGPGEEGLFRLVNRAGVWATGPSGTPEAPLAEPRHLETEGDPEDPDDTHEEEPLYQDELARVSSLAELAELVKG